MHRGHRRILSKRCSPGVGGFAAGSLRHDGPGLRKKAERAMMKDGNP
jgi:hypothetical protein